MVGRIWKILTFRADLDDYQALDRRYLAVGLVVTWIVGIGRYWDNPRVEILQKAGLGSVVYVFALSALLWLLGLGLRPERWGYVRLLTFVTLTAAPGILYAIPVERYAWLVFLTYGSVLVFPFLALGYIVLAITRRRGKKDPGPVF